MYGKSYESKYDGSMIGAGFNVWSVWDYITTKSRDGFIEVNPKLLSFILGGPEAEVESALEFLCRPDPDSRSKREEGRKLVKEGQFMYRIVNWAEYNRIRTEVERREYNRRMQAEWREKQRMKLMKKGRPLRGEAAAVKALDNGDEKTFERIAGEA